MAILSSVEQFINNCKETITEWFSTWANTNINGKYLPLTGGNLTGEVTSTKKISSSSLESGTLSLSSNTPYIKLKYSDVTSGTIPSSDKINGLYFQDKDGKTLGIVWNELTRISNNTDVRVSTHMCVHKFNSSSEHAQIIIYHDNTNGYWTYAPTPNTNVSLTNQIATAGWVNDKIASIPTTGTYTLPTASSSTKGGIKVGNGLQVSSEVLSIKLASSSNLSVDSNGLKNTYKYTHHTQNTIAFGPSSNATIANGGTFQIPQIAVDGEGHTTSITARTMTLPKYEAGTGITISGNIISSSVASLSIGSATGTGNAVTSLSISNNKIVPNLGSKFSLDGHTHSGYAASNHNHDSVYSKLTHNHDSAYAAKSHTHSYAPLASPELTGTPTAPTATAGTNTTQIATTAFVGTAVSNALSSVSVNLNLSAATVSKSSGSSYVSGSVGAVLWLLGNDPSFLIFPKGTSWLIVGVDLTSTSNDDSNSRYTRISQVVTIASDASTSNRLLYNLVSGKPTDMSGYAIRVA